MIGIEMKPNIPVHYQKGNTLQKGNPPLPTYNPLPQAPPPIFFYSICTRIVLQEKIIPLLPPPPPPPPLPQNIFSETHV